MRVRLISWISAAGLVLAVGTTVQAQKTTSTPCKDGTTSTASGRGACSGHGGVDGQKLAAQKKEADVARSRVRKSEKAAAKVEKARKTEARTDAKAERKEDKAEAKMVKCTDGTMSKGGRGACSHHGGIAKAAKR